MKTINKLFCFLLTFVILVTFVGCEKETEKQNIIYDSAVKIQSLDPQLAEDTFHRELSFNLFEGLMKFNEKGVLVLGAASSYKVKNIGLRIEFQIDKTKQHNRVFWNHRKCLLCLILRKSYFLFTDSSELISRNINPYRIPAAHCIGQNQSGCKSLHMLLDISL